MSPPNSAPGSSPAIYLINYLGVSVPVLIAGVATAHFGLHRTALAYCVAMTALVAAAVGSLVLPRRGPIQPV